MLAEMLAEGMGEGAGASLKLGEGEPSAAGEEPRSEGEAEGSGEEKGSGEDAKGSGESCARAPVVANTSSARRPSARPSLVGFLCRGGGRQAGGGQSRHSAPPACWPGPAPGPPISIHKPENLRIGINEHSALHPRRRHANPSIILQIAAQEATAARL